MPDDASSIIAELFEHAARETSMSLVAVPLEALWRDGNWTSSAIASQLETVAQSLLREDGS
ncbi:MAG: hypothetical protein ACYDA3_08185 [Gaiellaceae bacterium]